MPAVRPTCKELVEAVREFLERDLLPELDGPLSFKTRVSINVVKIIERELAFGDAADEAERERLRGLLGRDGTREELNRALCQQLRSEAQDVQDPRLIEHLRKTTIAKLSIDNPSYSSYLSAKQAADPR